jgi:hypothetical protein
MRAASHFSPVARPNRTRARGPLAPTLLSLSLAACSALPAQQSQAGPLAPATVSFSLPALDHGAAVTIDGQLVDGDPPARWSCTNSTT